LVPDVLQTLNQFVTPDMAMTTGQTGAIVALLYRLQKLEKQVIQWKEKKPDIVKVEIVESTETLTIKETENADSSANSKTLGRARRLRNHFAERKLRH
jgi:hypothetical protein